MRAVPGVRASRPVSESLQPARGVIHRLLCSLFFRFFTKRGRRALFFGGSLPGRATFAAGFPVRATGAFTSTSSFSFFLANRMSSHSTVAGLRSFRFEL